MAAAMTCKRGFSHASIQETGVSKTGKAKTPEAKTRFSCIAEALESTRQRRESVSHTQFFHLARHHLTAHNLTYMRWLKMSQRSRCLQDS